MPVKNSTPIHIVTSKELPAWLKKQPKHVANVAAWQEFKAEAGSFVLVADGKGNLERVLLGAGDGVDLWTSADLPKRLPAGAYYFEGNFSKDQATQLMAGWKLGCYQFSKYKKPTAIKATLAPLKLAEAAYVNALVESVTLARDLINIPANDMHTLALAAEAKKIANKHKASYQLIQGEQLIKQNFPAIYAVGKASSQPPALVDIGWGNAKHKKVTLVGKGVCFDTGGLDLKSSSNMLLMKKDMGGAANALALAHMIMAAKLPVRLRVLLPIVENAVSGNAMRPSDVIQTRKGLTVEVGNTDAEGRLILCDALAEADGEKPDLLFDFATLTGAARVALGTDVPAFFTHDDALAKQLMQHSRKEQDAIWRLPLVKEYATKLKSQIADLNNDPSSGYGGAISAALFLDRFVEHCKRWVHIDMMAWNVNARAGRPIGGEAQAIRACFSLIKEMYERR